MNISKGKYEYDIVKKGDVFIISTKIFLRNVKNPKIKHTDIEYQDMVQTVKDAENFWNNNVPSNMPLKFIFDVVQNKPEAYFRPALVRKNIRGPYYAGWSTFWPVEVVAHEIGHMFGLNDEYVNSPLGPSSEFCDHRSLMCRNTADSFLLKRHFETIFTRLHCLN